MFYDPAIGFYSYAIIDGQVMPILCDPYAHGGDLQALQQSPVQPLQQSLAHQSTGPYLSYGAHGVALNHSVHQQSAISSSQPASEDVETLISTILNHNIEEAELPVTPEVAELATDLRNSLPLSKEEEEDSSMISSYTAHHHGTHPQPHPHGHAHQVPVLPSIRSLTPDILPPPLTIVKPKQQYQYPPEVSHRPSSYASASPVTLPSINYLPPSSTPRVPPTPLPQQSLSVPRVPIASPASPVSAPSSPPQSPKRSKKNYTKEFNNIFHELLNQNDHAMNEWHLYSHRYKGKCTIKRAPCIKVSRGFCASYGQEFSDLAKEEKYGALGTRTECNCKHKPSPLSPAPQVSGGSSRKRARTASYQPPSRDSNMAECEPSSPEAELNFSCRVAPLSKQTWRQFLEQHAAVMCEGFNSVMGGAQCVVCGTRRSFTSRKEVMRYLMRETIHCDIAGCSGSMHLLQ